MPYIRGSAESLEDLVSHVVSWATDSAIHGTDVWECVQNEPWPKGTIFKAKGQGKLNHCYIGLMIVDLSLPDSYSKWLLTEDTIKKKILWDSDRLGKHGFTMTAYTPGSDVFEVWKNPETPVLDKKEPPKYPDYYDYDINDKQDPERYTTFYQLLGYNSLSESYGKILVFGVFKQFFAGLNFDEQPGGLVPPGDMEMFDIYYRQTDKLPFDYEKEPIKLKPPVYPGLGFPGISFPTGEPSDGLFSYWLVKDHSNLTIVTQNREYFDFGHAGLLEPRQAAMQYAFPGVVAGTCTGFKNIHEVYWEDKKGWVRKDGNKHSFSYENITVSHGLPIAPNKKGCSQLAVCLPDGRWEYFSNWQQATGEIYWRPFGQYPRESRYPKYERPTRESNTADGFRVYPNNLELADIDRGFSDIDELVLEPIQMFQHNFTEKRRNNLGSMRRIHWPNLELPVGESIVNGKKVLFLPNCWEDRLWWVVPYKDSTGGIITQENFTKQYKEIIDYGKQFRMLIELED